jgi:hypothetical protein
MFDFASVIHRARGGANMLQVFNPGGQEGKGANQVPITPFLQSKVFDPELTKAMGIAFEKACRTLRLKLTSDPATEAVARVIIGLAEAGERDPELLYQRTVAHFSDDEH